MERYFSPDYAGEPFRLFSQIHIYTLVLLAITAIISVFLFARAKNNISKSSFRYMFSALLVFLELSIIVWSIVTGEWSLAYSLPLHLCDAAMILSIVMLVNRNQQLFEIAYFWGLGGSLQALLTPDLVDYSFPHFLYIQFFTAHGAIIIAVLYMIFAENYRPSHISIWKVLAITNAYMLFVALINLTVDGNYLFICHKPSGASLMDYLGPWPWYILNLELVAAVVFYICYIPFALKDFFGERGGIGHYTRGRGIGA